MSEEMIEPCPWCSGKAVAQQYCARNWGCGCKTDACWVQPEAYATSRPKAISEWNTRAYNPNERLREALERIAGMTEIETDFDGFEAREIARAALSPLTAEEEAELVERINANPLLHPGSALSPLPQGED